MPTNSENRLEAIFHAAKELASPEQREVFLRDACQGDAVLLNGVNALLQASDQAEKLFRPTKANDATMRTPLAEQVGDRIGRYKLLQQIGEGGCGVVYMAEQSEPVKRRVALKVIKLGMDTKSVIARFEAERQALAMMDHPNIAKVLDAGATESGRPYFVMELVRGMKITEYCDEAKLPTHQRLELFIQVCQAVQHAHQKGIIHRDLKPSNILVTVNDGVPVPKVIDFGIAKATNQQPLTDKTLFTAFEQFIGTPAYMSPEQAVMTSLDVDTRSDIYSLGVLLYELLTGQTPIDAKELLSLGLDEMRRAIRENEPVRPSTRLSTMIEGDLTPTAKLRQVDVPKLIHQLRGDLDWIVMKALEKDRARRYETANGFAMDIQRHLNNEPVVARPPSAAYRFQKLVRRNKLAFAAAGAVAGTLVLGVMVSTWQAVQATQARRAAEESELRARQAQNNEREEKNRAEAEANRAEKNAAEALKNLIQQYVDNGNRLTEEDDLLGALPWYVKALELEKDPAATLRHRFRIGANLHLAPKLVQLWTHDGPVNDIVFSPDGRLIASASDDKTARLWDSETGESFGPVLRHSNAVTRVIFSPDAARLFTIAANEAKLWSVTNANGELIADIPHGVSPTDAQFSPNGKWLITGCNDSVVRLCDARNGQVQRRLLHPKPVHSLAFSPNSKLVVTGAEGDRVRLWDVEKAASIFTNAVGHGKALVAFSPNGNLYASLGNSGGAIYDTSTGELVRTFMLASAAGNWVSGALSFSPEGNRLLIGTSEQILVCDAESGIQITSIDLKGNRFEIGAFVAQFSPDGREIITRARDGAAHVWSAKTGAKTHPPLHHSRPVTAATFGPDSRRIVTGSMDGAVKLWDLASEASVEPKHMHHFMSTGAKWSVTGASIFAGNYAAMGYVWDSATGQSIGAALVHHPRFVGSIGGRWSNDGRRLVTVGEGAFRVWNAATLTPLTPTVHVRTNASLIATFSPDGAAVVVAGELPELRFYSASTGQLMASSPSGHSGQVLGYEFTSRKRWAFSWGNDQVVLLRNPTNGVPVAPPIKHNAAVWEASASHNETRLATRCADGTMHLWEIPSGHELLPSLRHGNDVRSIRFSSDDQWLLTAEKDGLARLWDARSGEPRFSIDNGAPLYGATINRAGSLIATGSARGARLWDGAVGEPLSPWFGIEARPDVSTVEFSPADDRLLTQAGLDSSATHVWNFRPDNRPLEVLHAHNVSLGGRAVSEGNLPVTAAWKKLRASSPERLIVTSDQALRWHRTLAESCYYWPDPYPLAFHAARCRTAHPEDAIARNQLAMGLLAQSRASEALEIVPDLIASRSPAANAEQLDLTIYYNQRLVDSDFTFDWDGFISLAPGLQTLGGVQFDVRGLIHLFGAGGLLTQRPYPPKCSPIPVHRRLQRLHMLQLPTGIQRPAR